MIPRLRYSDDEIAFIRNQAFWNGFVIGLIVMASLAIAVYLTLSLFV